MLSRVPATVADVNQSGQDVLAGVERMLGNFSNSLLSVVSDAVARLATVEAKVSALQNAVARNHSEGTERQDDAEGRLRSVENLLLEVSGVRRVTLDTLKRHLTCTELLHVKIQFAI